VNAAMAHADDAAARRLADVRARIETACQRAGRPPASVVLIAVGKTHPPEAVQQMVDLGVRDVAENRVGELLAKQPRVRGASWHFVGQLQRRKAPDVVGHRVLIHSVDRRRLVDTLARRSEDADVVQRVLVQVNVGEDPAKGGAAPDEALDLVAYARERSHLSVEGLMTIPPLPADDVDPGEASREHFAALRRLRDRARERWPEVIHLSMGMTADLEAAIEEGATMVRVGTALFGPRRDGPWRPAGGSA
jgi:pyridoxal phosphate enzyme (YggS family)